MLDILPEEKRAPLYDLERLVIVPRNAKKASILGLKGMIQSLKVIAKFNDKLGNLQTLSKSGGMPREAETQHPMGESMPYRIRTTNLLASNPESNSSYQYSEGSRFCNEEFLIDDSSSVHAEEMDFDGPVLSEQAKHVKASAIIANQWNNTSNFATSTISSCEGFQNGEVITVPPNTGFLSHPSIVKDFSVQRCDNENHCNPLSETYLV
jgi:hypothetical protein